LHELSLAQNIVDSITAEANARGARKVLELKVDVGELMQIDTKALRFGLKLLMTGPVLKGARVRVGKRSASFKCRKCSSEWGMAEARRQLERVSPDLLVQEPDSKEIPLHFFPYLYPAFVRCPKCGSADVEVKGGKEIEIAKLVLEEGP
jgi:hydrogenase nickel incorporation protein HypA/HybF